MLAAGAGHGENLAIEVFAFDFGLPFLEQVLLRG
jgi:hypothetical protein